MADKVKVYGKAQNRTALGIVHAYLKLHPDANLEELRKAFPGDIHTKSFNKQYLHLFYPQGGVKHDCGPKDGELLDAKALDLDFFDEEDELIDLADGTRIYFQKFWSENDYLRMVEKAKEYDITVEEFEKTEKSFEKGNYRLEYINGYVPPVAKAPKNKDGKVRFANSFADLGDYSGKEDDDECSCCCWIKKILAILAILLMLLLLFFLVRGCNTKTDDRKANLCGCCGEDVDLNAKAGGQNDANANALADAEAARQKAIADSIAAAEEAARKAVQDELDALRSKFAAIRFKETGSAKLNDNSKKELDEIAELLQKHPDFKIKVIGHASKDGTDEANQTVSDKRAQATKDYLMSKGISEDRILTEGRGSREPVSETDPLLNRRTEFEITK